MWRDHVKYEVYRKQEKAFETFDHLPFAKPLPPESYFVIRQSDIFGSAALWGYAHLVQTSIEIARQRPGTFTDEECDRLTQLATELAEKAEAWSLLGGQKVPD